MFRSYALTSVMPGLTRQSIRFATYHEGEELITKEMDPRVKPGSSPIGANLSLATNLSVVMPRFKRGTQ
jgi:hypothetical protein